MAPARHALLSMVWTLICSWPSQGLGPRCALGALSEQILLNHEAVEAPNLLLRGDTVQQKVVPKQGALILAQTLIFTIS
jgi:hypothetical protein